MATHKEYLSYSKTTVLCKQVLNHMNQMLIVKDLNYLATDLKKLAPHKCVATPWLRTTALNRYLAKFKNHTVSFTDLDQGREILSRFSLPKSMKHSV